MIDTRQFFDEHLLIEQIMRKSDWRQFYKNHMEEILYDMPELLAEPLFFYFWNSEHSSYFLKVNKGLKASTHASGIQKTKWIEYSTFGFNFVTLRFAKSNSGKNRNI